MISHTYHRLIRKFSHSAVSPFDNAFCRLLSISASLTALSITCVAVLFHQNKIHTSSVKIQNMLISVLPTSHAMIVNISTDIMRFWCWFARRIACLPSSASEVCFASDFSSSLATLVTLHFLCDIWNHVILIASLKCKVKSSSIGVPKIPDKEGSLFWFQGTYG